MWHKTLDKSPGMIPPTVLLLLAPKKKEQTHNHFIRRTMVEMWNVAVGESFEEASPAACKQGIALVTVHS